MHSRFFSLAALAACALFGIGVSPASAADHFVAPSGLKAKIAEAGTLNGDTIFVSAGTTSDYIVVNKSLTIKGAKMDTPGAAPSRGTGESVFTRGMEIAANDVTLNGVTLQGAVRGGYPDGWGTWVRPTTSNATFINNVVQDNVVGLYLNGTGHTVQYNLFRSNNRTGSLSGDAIYSDSGLHGAVIADNSFTGHSAGAIVVVGGVKGGTVSELTIDGNSIVNDGTIAIFNATDVEITNNLICNIRNGHGIHLGGGDVRVLIQANQILASRYRGIRIANSAKFPTVNEDIHIFENDIANNTLGGLSVIPGSYTDAGGVLDTVANNRVQAECNAWGSVNGPLPESGGGNKVSGPADYTPFRKYMNLTSHVGVTLLQTYSASGTHLQVIRITNNGGKAVVGNAYYVLDNLAANGVTWVNPSAGSQDDACQPPVGSPWYKFVNSGGANLLPGQSLIVTLKFTAAGAFDTTKIGGTDGTLLNPVGRRILATNYR
ncbi:MAG: hypothetical protein ACO1SX_18050 [Actinomycetota bacterium]